MPDSEIGSARIQEVSSMSVSVQKHKNLVGGEWVDASDGGTEEVINPATGETIAEVPKGTEADVDRAVEAAKKAWAEWRGVTPAERAELLLKLADLIDEHTEELAEIESRNVGKPLGAARDEMPVCSGQHPLLRRRRAHPRGPLRGRVHAGLHVDDPPRADRDRRPGRAVELPADDGGLEVRTRARRGQRLDPQALGADAALDAALRGARRRRDPGRRPQRDHGRRRAGRRRHRPPPGRPHGLAHRRRRDRQGGREGRVRDAEARPPRARRQGAGRRLRRCRSRPGRRGDQGRRLLELRARTARPPHA